MGAWIGATAVDVARSGGLAVGLPDLLRLHADALTLERAGVDRTEVRALLSRLEAAVDVVVDAVDRARS